MSQHVVFFGIDGAQLSRIKELNAQGRLPEFNRFFVQEAYVGGDIGTPTQQTTMSGPGWASLLTGTWANTHGITENNDKQVAAAASSIFERIHAGLPDADIRSYATWWSLNSRHFAQEYKTVIDQGTIGATDARNIDLSIQAINQGADFIFTHYDEVDHVGHELGGGPEQDAALIDAIRGLSRLLDAVKAREASHPEEKWLLIASTDHGRDAIAEHHGGQSASERQSFILTDEPILQSTRPVPVTAVATTILDFMNIPFSVNELSAASILKDNDTNGGTPGGTGTPVVFWSENFEGLKGKLGAYVSDTESGGDGTDWTATAPTGWKLNDSTTPTGGPVEFQGWTFHDRNSWSATADDQGRSEFTFGQGVVAVADPDEYQDGVELGSDGFNAFMRTGSINLAGYQNAPVTISFDSSFKAEGTQTGTLRASFDGGATFQNVFVLDSEALADAGSMTNQRISTTIAPKGASSVILEFGMTEAGNNWWWAVDNIQLAGTAAPKLCWSENFESKVSQLSAYVSATESGGDGTDWTASAPVGWTLNDANTPTGGPAEFQGWTYHDRNSWIATSGDQLRSEFKLGQGVVAVADPDEYHDGNVADTGSFNAFMKTGRIDLTGATGENFEFVFDSSFRAEGNQTASVRASFDGGSTYNTIFTLDSAGMADTPEHLNREIKLNLDSNGASSVMFEFGLTEAGNNWWWAVDNLELWSVA